MLFGFQFFWCKKSFVEKTSVALGVAEPAELCDERFEQHRLPTRIPYQGEAREDDAASHLQRCRSQAIRLVEQWESLLWCGMPVIFQGQPPPNMAFLGYPGDLYSSCFSFILTLRLFHDSAIMQQSYSNLSDSTLFSIFL